MPVKLLSHLRFLNQSLPLTRFSTMKPTNPSVKHYSSHVIPIFSRIFPHKLKYQSLTKLGLPNEYLGFRRFSSRSRSGQEAEVRASKSLIDDEAELSDWVSGLRSNSFQTHDDDSGSGSGRGSSNGRGRGSDRDDYSMGKDSFSREKTQFGGKFEGKDEGFVSRRGDNNSTMSKRGGRGSEFGYGRGGGGRGNGRGGGGLNRGEKSIRRGGFVTSDEDIGNDSEGEGRLAKRGRRGSDFSYGPGGGGGWAGVGEGRSNGSGGLHGSGKSLRKGGFVTSNDEIDDDDDEEEEEEEEGRLTKRGGRGSDSGFGRDRGGRSNGSGGLKGSGKSLRKGCLVTSDEEIGDDDVGGGEGGGLMNSFSDLISEEEDGGDDDDDMLKNVGSLFAGKKGATPQAVPSLPGRSDLYLSETRFNQFSVSSSSLKGIKDAGYEKMTVVQEETLPIILKGKDVLAKAKTGTGKTVAFLLPSIEVVVKTPSADRDQRRPPIIVLVICPTRELARGTRLALEQKRIQANPCQILVATPGRLKDHIENTAGFATRLMGLKVLVLDEADHLLDMGFRKDIERIIASVPKQRQTLLFFATVPKEVRQICHIALKRDNEFIDTVRQMHLVAPLDKHFPLLYVLLKEHIADDVDYKVLVFCTTAMVTRLVADLLGELSLNVREIHSRKPQSYRARISDEFRKSKGLILVTSDVSARGVDYPDVTLVIQVGLPADREQYVHRLGRTGRKGKEGQGILLLAPWEESFLSSVKDLPIAKAPIPSIDPETKKKVERALSHVEMKNKEAAYQAWLGYYKSNKIVGRD
ncbi:hypothetical protein Vadar_034401 [Vaccinium darrowii]|uniref:Uncharacterized protein n=1 Tax=Vaccinium darrowii TaxID=229202 RepID=A0ACB7ZH84_9ERIC|nr:hypothetical protein Vadar_034401 [Vaccinium darrowii]